MALARRGVVRHEKFDECVDKLRDSYPRIDELIDGITWEISKNPQAYGVKDPRVDVFRAHHAGSPALPPALIYYSYTDRIVLFLTIVLLDD